MGAVDRRLFASSSLRGAELVVGIVAPVGTDVDFVESTIRDRLKQFRYELQVVRLSALIEEFPTKTELVTEPHHVRIGRYMDGGNELRASWGRGDVLALAAIGAVKKLRQHTIKEGPRPFTAYFLRTLKHPDEVQTLREVYGRGFFLVGVSSPKASRLEVLTKQKQVPKVDAENLLTRDESEAAGHGQQTRSAFHLADAFVALGSEQEASRKEIWRILDLLFGQPFITPSKDEYAMFLAYSASVRSADLSRQVGAVLVSERDEVIAMGANEVPTPGGDRTGPMGTWTGPRTRPQATIVTGLAASIQTNFNGKRSWLISWRRSGARGMLSRLSPRSRQQATLSKVRNKHMD